MFFCEYLREILVGIVVIPGCGDIPGGMLRGDVECYVVSLGCFEVSGECYINMSIFVDFYCN